MCFASPPAPPALNFLRGFLFLFTVPPAFAENPSTVPVMKPSLYFEVYDRLFHMVLGRACSLQPFSSSLRTSPFPFFLLHSRSQDCFDRSNAIVPSRHDLRRLRQCFVYRRSHLLEGSLLFPPLRFRPQVRYPLLTSHPLLFF